MILSGFQNEIDLTEELNNKKFKDLSLNLQSMIKAIDHSVTDIDLIKAVKKGGTSKADILLTIGDVQSGISVKKGTGNSVHQEPLEEFIKFISKTYSVSEELKIALRKYIWGDGTLDGTGDPKDRKDSYWIKKNCPEDIVIIQDFLDKNKQDLITRFIKKGTHDGVYPAEYIYYGVNHTGMLMDTDQAINLLMSQKKPSLSVGGLTFQAWNRNIKNTNPNTEKKRGVIQLKWGSMYKDFNISI